MPTLHQSPHALVTLDAAGIATLTLTNAGPLNIVGTPAIRDLCAALQLLVAEPDLRGVHTVAGDYQQDELAARMVPLCRPASRHPSTLAVP